MSTAAHEWGCDLYVKEKGFKRRGFSERVRALAEIVIKEQNPIDDQSELIETLEERQLAFEEFEDVLHFSPDAYHVVDDPADEHGRHVVAVEVIVTGGLSTAKNGAISESVICSMNTTLASA